MKFLLKPDYFSPDERTEIGGLYGITLPMAEPDELYKQINDKEEITRFAFYSRVRGREPIAAIDERLLEFY